VWGFAHLPKYPGAIRVTTGLQKGQGRPISGNVARMFEKARRPFASWGAQNPKTDRIRAISPNIEIGETKYSSADSHALE
jgi:hypothetical protein